MEYIKEVIIDWNKAFKIMKFDIVNELKRRCPIHDGYLKNSIRGEVVNNLLNIWMLEYGIYIERGTLPHSVNPEVLKKWCKDKLGNEKLAYAVARHIQLFGTKPHRFIKNTIKQEFKKILAKALAYEGVVKVLGDDGIIYETKPSGE